jgi:hypothetical protein
VTEHIYRLCNLLSTKNKIIKYRHKPNPLYELDLQYFLSALIFVASQYGRFIDTRGKFIVSLKRNAEIHTLLCKAFSAFDNWPNSFFSFLDWRRVQMPNKKFAYGLRREFGEYKSVLYGQNSSKHLDFMRRTFEDYLTTQWQGGYLSHMRRISPSARRNAKYLPMKEAQRLLGTPYIFELIESGRLKAVVMQHDKRRLVLIERAGLINFRRALKHALTLAQLRKLLALSSARIKELVKAGLINPLRGPTVDGLTTWKFNNTEARKLIEVFKNKIIEPAKAQARRELTFKEVLSKLDYYGVGFSKLVQAVLCKEIRPSRLNKNKGLTRFFFLDEQITNFIKCASQLQGEEAYSVAAVAKLLRSSKRVVWFLIRNGFIHARRLSSLSSAGLIITKTELEQFNSKFLLAKNIASQLGTNPRYICELLITHGIHPILSRNIHRGPLIVFKKSDLDGIDLDALVSITKSEARIVLPCPFKKSEAVTLNETQAAAALGIAVDAIEQLVERGVLKPHRYKRPSREDAEKYFFPVRTIEKWKGQSTIYTSVVAFLSAAKMIGSRPTNFYKKYIQTGRLKAVITGKQRGEHYFLLAEVEAIIKLNKQTITASEAAVICKVNLSCIHKLTVIGKLKPISGPNIDGFGHNLYLRTDAERLHAERETFKAKRNDEGGSSRFGRPAGPNRQPVRNEVRPRIEQLVKEWSVKPKGQPLSGQRLHRQLAKEGYRVGINTIYVCLRELRRQVEVH